MTIQLLNTCEMSACPGMAVDPDLFCFMASARADMSGKPAILSAFGNIPIGMNRPKKYKSQDVGLHYQTTISADPGRQSLLGNLCFKTRTKIKSN